VSFVSQGETKMSEPTKNQRYRFWYDVHCEGHWKYLTVKDVTAEHVWYKLDGSDFHYPMTHETWEKCDNEKVEAEQ